VRLRLAAIVLIGVLVAIPLAVLPAAPVTLLTPATLVVGGVGVLALSRVVVTVGASLAVITYALALGIARPPFDPLAAITFGGTLVLLLTLVPFARHVQGAAVDPPVIAAQVRQWLRVVALGAVAAAGLTAGGALVAPALGGATLPVAVAAVTFGAVLAAAGVIGLVLYPLHRVVDGTSVAERSADFDPTTPDRTSGGPA
jgi:hypothetical protein